VGWGENGSSSACGVKKKQKKRRVTRDTNFIVLEAIVGGGKGKGRQRGGKRNRKKKTMVSK